jgi:hypothetical protein
MGDPFDLKKFALSLFPASGEWWGKTFNLVWRLALVMSVILITVFGIGAIKEKFFPSKKPSTSSTTLSGNVESGATVNVTNVNNPVSDLKQGIYGKMASDRATLGVFKEVLPNLDISLGAGKAWDDDDGSGFVFETEARFKF